MARLHESTSALTFQFAKADERLLLRGVQSWFTMLDECKDEVTDFVTMRLAKDGAAARDCQMCTSLHDVLAIQSRWAAEAAQDLGAEISRFWWLLAKFDPAGCLRTAGRVDGPPGPVPGLLFY
jgi:hypothetical protein